MDPDGSYNDSDSDEQQPGAAAPFVNEGHTGLVNVESSSNTSTTVTDSPNRSNDNANNSRASTRTRTVGAGKRGSKVRKNRKKRDSSLLPATGIIRRERKAFPRGKFSRPPPPPPPPPPRAPPPSLQALDGSASINNNSSIRSVCTEDPVFVGAVEANSVNFSVYDSSNGSVDSASGIHINSNIQFEDEDVEQNHHDSSNPWNAEPEQPQDVEANVESDSIQSPLLEATLVRAPPELQGEIIVAQPVAPVGWSRCLPDTSTREGKWLCCGLSGMVLILLGAGLVAGAVCGSGLCSSTTPPTNSDVNSPTAASSRGSSSCTYQRYQRSFGVTFNGDPTTAAQSDLTESFLAGYKSIEIPYEECPATILDTQLGSPQAFQVPQKNSDTRRFLQPENNNSNSNNNANATTETVVQFVTTFVSVTGFLLASNETDVLVKGMNIALSERNITALNATDVFLPTTPAPSVFPSGTPSAEPSQSAAPSANPTAWTCELCSGTDTVQLPFEIVAYGSSPHLNCGQLEVAYKSLSVEECAALESSGDTLDHQTFCVCPGYETTTGNCFEDRLELYRGVDAYIEDRLPGTEVANAYGWPIGEWCVSNIEDFKQAFSARRNDLLSSFNEPLGNWDMSNAVVLDEMFRDAVLFDQDISKWQLGNSNNRTRLNCGDGDISLWNTSSVTTMRDLFRESQFNNEGIAQWDVGAVVSFQATFRGTEFCNVNISATSLDSMFSGSMSFDQPIGAWNTTNVQNFESLFSVADAFNQDLSGWNLASATGMGGMFQSSQVFQQDLCSWGAQLQGREVDLGIVSFSQSDCPNTNTPDLLANPPGPFCFTCTKSPTLLPTTQNPTTRPTTAKPALSSSMLPTTKMPTVRPTLLPSTENSTLRPTLRPTSQTPTARPSLLPTTGKPSLRPTLLPTTGEPTLRPTLGHTTQTPTDRPSLLATTGKPTIRPTMLTLLPTTENPTTRPTGVASTAEATCELCPGGTSVRAPEKEYDFDNGSTSTCAEIEVLYSTLDAQTCSDYAEGSTSFFQSFCECPGSQTCELCPGGASVGVPERSTMLGSGREVTCSQIEDSYRDYDSQACSELEEGGTTLGFQSFCECPGLDQVCELCPGGATVGVPEKERLFSDGTTYTCAQIEALYVHFDDQECTEIGDKGSTASYQSFCECPGFQPEEADCELCPLGTVGLPSKFMDFDQGRKTCTEWEEHFAGLTAAVCSDVTANGVLHYTRAGCGCPGYEPECPVCPYGSVQAPDLLLFGPDNPNCAQYEIIFLIAEGGDCFGNEALRDELNDSCECSID